MVTSHAGWSDNEGSRLRAAALVPALSMGGLVLGAIILSASGAGAIVIVWVFIGLVFTAFNVATVLRSGRHGDRPTGVVLSPPTEPTVQAVLPSAMRWVGGASVLGTFGRLNASAPLAVLALNGVEISLQLRPAFIARLFGLPTRYVARSGDDFEVFPTRGMLPGTRGVGIRPRGRPAVYFWTRRRDEILAAAASRGFAVNWAEQRFRY